MTDKGNSFDFDDENNLKTPSDGSESYEDENENEDEPKESGKKKRGQYRKKRNKKGFIKIKALHCYEAMHKKICAGIAIEEVARWVQEDMMEYTDTTRGGLVRQLYRYRSTLPPGQIVTKEPTYIEKAIEKMHRGVKELEELEKLYLFQKQRIGIDAETEQKINKLFTGTNKEIDLAKNLLTEMVRIKQELGVLDKVPIGVELMGGVQVKGAEDISEDQKLKLGLLASRMVDALVKKFDEKDNKKEEDEGENSINVAEE